MSFRRSLMLPIIAALLLLVLPLVSAQFHFFDGMWGHQQQQQQHHSSGASQWAAHVDSVRCSSYLCPQTLDCVINPADCPCPAVEDIKCTIPDTVTKDAATVVCVRGKDGCSEVEKLMKGQRK